MTAQVLTRSVDASLGMRLLPTVLSMIAGSVDAISFLGLGGLFTAQGSPKGLFSGPPIIKWPRRA
jgi:uncharacterized membrane protein YoaK (UPF0700 family)